MFTCFANSGYNENSMSKEVILVIVIVVVVVAVVLEMLGEVIVVIPRL